MPKTNIPRGLGYVLMRASNLPIREAEVVSDVLTISEAMATVNYLRAQRVRYCVWIEPVLIHDEEG
jgi:hypothetical protein